MKEVDDLYKMRTTQDNYINPIIDGTLSWRYARSCTSDSDESLENWQNQMHEILGRCCAHLTKSLPWIGSEVSQVPIFSVLSLVKEILNAYDVHVPSSQRLQALDVALRATPARWWATHRKSIATWETCHRLLMIRFGEKVERIKCQYDGHNAPRLYIEFFSNTWQHHSAYEWVHLFVHTLAANPRNWYTKIELCGGTESWPLLAEGFELNFQFAFEHREVDDALAVIKTKIFEDGPFTEDTK